MPNEFKVKNGLVVDQGGANITGSSNISGSLGLISSGSNVLTVDGASGRLFTVDDSLSGSLFSVNNVAGLPVIEAFSDNTVRLGQFGEKALFVSQSSVGFGKETSIGAKVDVSGSVQITGSLSVTTGITGSLYGTASWAQNAPAANIVVAAGGSTNTVSQLVFSNGGGISFGLNGSTLTATRGPYKSYFGNVPVIQGTSAISLGGSSNYVLPFIIPYDVSVSYIRLIITNQFTSNTIGTTNNTTVNFRQSQTYYFNIYSLGNGASSRSLQQYTQASATILYGITGQQGTSTNQQSVSHAYSYPTEGGTSTFSTSYSLSAANLAFSTTQLTALTGFRFLDIPFNNSLASGQWFVGLQRSSATATTGGGGNLSLLTNNNSFIMATQFNQTINPIGLTNSTAASIFSTNGIQPGLGFWTTNSAGATTNSLALSQLSVIANQPILPFQFIRQQ